MASDVDAVIAALRTILGEAETRVSEYRWKTHVVNRWINQLPGAWTGRWRHLKLRSDFQRSAPRADLISHVRATLAYLETHREVIGSERRSWWPFGMSTPQPTQEPQEVAVEEVSSAGQVPRTETVRVRPKWLN